MKKRSLALCVIVMATWSAQAQTIIRGIVTDRDSQKGLAAINVSIQEKGSPAMVAYTMTDDKGAFRLEYKGQKDSITVIASGFNMSKQTRTVANRSQEVNFVTFNEAIAIKEVRVTAKSIKQAGDTIKYSVGGYIEQNDRTLSDVLKKLPGLEVRDNGSILYNNRPINSYYIEGMDLLKGRYGLANNTIQAKDVSEVQVLENHQPIKALQDKEFSEDAAINIKLKEGAKGNLIAHTLLGAGVSNDLAPLWTGELSAMYFTKKMQNITTYKGNNTGNDVSREQVLMFGPGTITSGSSNWLSVQSPSAPAISQNRYLNNRTNAFSFNNAWGLKQGYQLNANVNFTNDRQDKSSYALTTYLLPDGNQLNIEERLTSRAYKNQGSADIILNANTKQFYLDNTLTLKGAWDTENGHSLTSTQDIYQHLDKPNYNISNAFRLIKNYSKTSYTFLSNNSYNSTPNTLRVEPMLYGDLFDATVSFTGLKQQLLLNNFSSNSSVAFGFDHGKWKQNYAIGFNANLQKLTTELYPLLSPSYTSYALILPDSLQNNLRWNRFEWQARPSFTYMYDRFRATLGLPLQYVILQVNDYIPKTKNHTGRLFLNPTLLLMYKLSACWETSLNAGYTNSLGGISNAYTGYLMNSYRNLQSNEGKLLEQQLQNYTFSLSYRNPVYSLFGSVNASYTNRHANLLFGNIYRDILRVQTTYDIPNTTEAMTVGGSISKGIDPIASTLTFRGNYTSSKGVQLNQEKLMHYDGQQYGLTGGINTKLWRWGSMSYEIRYANSQRRVEQNDNRTKPISTMSQQAKLNLFPIKNLTLNFSFEHFYNNAIESGNRNMSFGDINLRYKWPKIEVMFDYTNIFNAKEYTSASYSETSAFYYAYTLRPTEWLLKVRFKLM